MVIWQITNGTQGTKGMESLTYCKAVQSQIYGHMWPAVTQNMGQKNLVIKPINALYWEIIPNRLEFAFYMFWPFMNLQVYNIVIHLIHLLKGPCRRQSIHSYRFFPNKVGLFVELLFLPILSFPSFSSSFSSSSSSSFFFTTNLSEFWHAPVSIRSFS